ncbi:MAG: transporter [Methylotenera sp. RIFCSPLOWO2_02_FULL_45_14]|nr:MAG: transporter [Methylotenera sp. RIFCSPLOWO2_02_FULL_45_14]
MKNNTHFKLTLLAAGLVASSGSTLAFALDNVNGADQSAYITSFKALDIDNSNSLTKSEVKSEELFAKHFAAADKNNDGTLDQEEYTNYKSQAEQKNVKRIAKDSVITSKVKGNLLKDEGLKSLKVSVKTHQGVVLLSGFVETKDQIQQAEKIAAATEGVKSVKNGLVLKKD